MDGSVWFFLLRRETDDNGSYVDSYEDVFPAISQAREAWKAFIIRTWELVDEELYESWFAAGTGGIDRLV